MESAMAKLREIMVAACLALAMSGAAAADPGAVGGKYRIDGRNPNGAPYGGTATITVTSSNTCRIVWATGGTTSEGICMRNQNAFSAGYVLQGDVGLVIYEINDDGSMDGLWTIADQPGVGKERLIPLR
jgi:hypothetical protein